MCWCMSHVVFTLMFKHRFLFVFIFLRNLMLQNQEISVIDSCTLIVIGWQVCGLNLRSASDNVTNQDKQANSFCATSEVLTITMLTINKMIFLTNCAFDSEKHRWHAQIVDNSFCHVFILPVWDLITWVWRPIKTTEGFYWQPLLIRLVLSTSFSQRSHVSYSLLRLE